MRNGSKRDAGCNFNKSDEQQFTPPLLGPTVARVNYVRSTPLLLGFLILLSCAGRQPQAAEPRALTASNTEVSLEPRARSIPAAQVLSGSIGPRLVETEQGFTLAWASPTQAGYQLLTSHVNNGVASEPREIVHYDRQLSQLLLSHSPPDGLTLLSVSGDKDGDWLEMIGLGEEGELRLPRRQLCESSGRIVWAQAVAVGGKEDSQLVFWAEKHGQFADMYVKPLRSTPGGRRYQIERNVSAWQLVEVGGRAALATVSAPSSGKAQTVYVRLIDEDGQLVDEPLLVAELKRGGLDLDMVSQADRLVLAWSEKVAGWSRLRLAHVDLSTGKSTTQLATPPRGDQSLLKLLSREHEINVIWEEPHVSVSLQRQIWLGAVSDSVSYPLSPLGHLRLSGSDPLLPSFTEDKAGIAMTAYGKLCEVQGSNAEPRCEHGQAQRFFARFDGRGLAYATPLSHQTAPEPAALVWELQCNTGGPSAERSGACAALVSDGSSPNRVFLFDSKQLEANEQLSKSWVASYVPASSGVAQLIGKEVLREVPELSKLSAVEMGERTTVSWLSYFDPNGPAPSPVKPAPDGRSAPVRAHLSTETFSSDALSFEQTLSSHSISLRARSWGGLDSASKERTSLLAWAALDEDDPQLFATIIDARGQKVRQKMLTRSLGEVFDVAVSRVPSGYVIAWVDGQGGNLDVWAMHVDEQLKAGPAMQISDSGITPSEVSLAFIADQLVIVWTDLENAQEEGMTQLRVASVDAQLSRVIMPERVLNTGDVPARSPQIALLSGEQEQLILSFITGSVVPELGVEAVGGDEGQPASPTQFDRGQLQYVMLPVRGTPDRFAWENLDLQAVDVPGVGAFSLDCTDRCRAVISSRASALQELWIAELAGHGADATQLLSLNTPSPETSVPLLKGRQLFYADTLEPGGPFQLLRATLTWNNQRP